MTRRRGRLLVAGFAVIVTVWLVGFSGLWARSFREPVVYGALVGRTEEEVRRKYGEPVREEQRYVAVGLVDSPTDPHDAPIKTLIFKPRGLFHLEDGTYYVWFVLRDGVWVCIDSLWFAEGVQF